MGRSNNLMAGADLISQWASQPGNLAWVIAGALLMLLVLGKVLLRFAAGRLFRSHKVLYGEKHQYIQVRATDFDWLDQPFYDHTRNWLSSQRFVHAGDLEDITITRRFPGMDTYYRIMLGDGGATAALFYHLKVRNAWTRFKRWLLRQPNDIKVIEFSTELEDGSYIITTSAPEVGGYGDAPNFIITSAPARSLLNEIMELHRDRVFQVLRGRNTRTRPRMNIDAMINSLHRVQQLRTDYRQEVGFVDSSEIRHLRGRKTGFIAGLIANEVDRLQKRKGFKKRATAVEQPVIAGEFDDVDVAVEDVPVTVIPAEPVRDMAALQKRAVDLFQADEEIDDNGEMQIRWERFTSALKKAVASTGVEHKMLIAMSMDGSEIGIGRMHGVKPYLCFNRPDESASIDNFKDYFLEGTMYDPPFSRIGAIVVGLDHNHLLYVLLEFLEEKNEEPKFTLSFDADWDKPTVLYLESEVEAGQARPFDARRAL